MLVKKEFLVLHLLIITTLACVTNTSISQIPTPRPTRTPVATFTNTPIPPTATPVPTATNTPLPSEVTPTSVPDADAVEAAVEATAPPTDTPLPTDTPVPPTSTPVPTVAPPTNPPPPTATPVPPPTAPAANSPLPTPTNPPEPGTPPGRYEGPDEDEIDGERNCAHIGVKGRVKDKGNDNPVQYVTIEVTGDDDDDDFRGPYVGKTGPDGRYSIVIGEFDESEQKFKAKVIGGPGVVSEDEVKWETSDDCHDSGNIQVVEIDWLQKRN